MSPTVTRPRSAALDAIRVVGIVAIVAGHTWPEQELTRSLISSWRVPAFFLLSGYLWSHHRGVGEDITKRARALMVPYFTWLVVIGVPFVVWRVVGHDDSPVRTGLGLLWGAQLGRPFSAFWFVAALFWTAVLVRVCQRLPRAGQWAVALAGLAAAAVWGPSIADTPYSLGLAAPCAFFVLVGQELKAVRPRIRRPGAWGAGLVAVALVTIYSGAFVPFDIKYGDFGRPAVSVAVALTIGMGLILLAETAVPGLPEGIQSVITGLAGAGLAVLLGHAGVLFLTDSRADWPLWVCFSLALAVPWAIGLVGRRTSLAPYLVGRPRVDAG